MAMEFDHITNPGIGLIVSTTEDSLGEEEEEDSNDDDSRPKERWAPLGAVASPEPGGTSSDEGGAGGDRLPTVEEVRRMEEEQEQLNGALMALTSHFSQVQFRLKQIVDAESVDREQLLKELEEFAFRGIPDARDTGKMKEAMLLREIDNAEHESKLEEQRKKQLLLIEQLKSQLEELELYAYETGEIEQPPTSHLMEKQKLVIDQLKQNLDIDLENFDKLSPEQLRQAVDSAIGQIVNPAKVKEKLVDQLKTQIVDLERFIEFLQGELDTPIKLEDIPGLKWSREPAKSNNPLSENGGPDPSGKGEHASSKKPAVSKPQPTSTQKDKESRERTLGIMRRALALLQLFAATQLGCGAGEDLLSARNLLKRRTGGVVSRHWGDLRAQLEVAIERVLETEVRMKVQARERRRLMSINSEGGGGGGHVPGDEGEREVFEEEYLSDTEEYIVSESHKELTQAVRKNLCPALRDLIQHGLIESGAGGQSRSLLPLGCFPIRASSTQRTVTDHPIHAWHLFTKFYELKRGREYNESPARKLSQSFDLDIVGGKAITNKQVLLSAVGTVIQSHSTYKKTDDSQFKALICMALNEKKLVPWLRLIVKNPLFIDNYYHPWGYASKTGFGDALHSLNRLNSLDFKLPYDLAVRQLKNIKDAF